MTLIFLGVLIVLPFEVSSFSKSDCLNFIANDELPQFTQPQSTGLSGLGAMLESYHKLQQKQQVGQLPQTNRAAACVSCGNNISAKSVHLTSLNPRHFEMLNRLGMRISHRQCSNNMKSM